MAELARRVYKVQIYICSAVAIGGIPFLWVYPLTAFVAFIMGAVGILGALIDIEKYKAIEKWKSRQEG